jgi:hypothetical protein
MTHHSNLKLNNGNGEMRKEGEEYTSCRNSKALQNIEQNIESLTEKMSGFELKLNYVLLRQTKSNKRKSTLHHQDSIKSITQRMNLKKLMNSSKARIKTSVIYLLLILILFYIILSNLSEFLLVGNELDY